MGNIHNIQGNNKKQYTKMTKKRSKYKPEYQEGVPAYVQGRILATCDTSQHIRNYSDNTRMYMD